MHRRRHAMVMGVVLANESWSTAASGAQHAAVPACRSTRLRRTTTRSSLSFVHSEADDRQDYVCYESEQTNP